MKILTILIAVAGLAVSAARANTLNFSGELTMTSPQFNRPEPGAPPGFLLGSNVYYTIRPLIVSETAVTTLTLPAASFDAFLCLYRTSFDSNDPLTNCLVADDDSGGGTLPAITATLQAGVQYYVVICGSGMADAGTFSAAYSSGATLSETTLSQATPTIKLKGKKRIVAKNGKAKIKGTFASPIGISEVTYKIGKKTRRAKLRNAGSPTGRWIIPLRRIDRGKTVVTIRGRNATAFSNRLKARVINR